MKKLPLLILAVLFGIIGCVTTDQAPIPGVSSVDKGATTVTVTWEEEVGIYDPPLSAIARADLSSAKYSKALAQCKRWGFSRTESLDYIESTCVSRSSRGTCFTYQYNQTYQCL